MKLCFLLLTHLSVSYAKIYTCELDWRENPFKFCTKFGVQATEDLQFKYRTSLVGNYDPDLTILSPKSEMQLLVYTQH
jgi:hypothetical protein